MYVKVAGNGHFQQHFEPTYFHSLCSLMYPVTMVMRLVTVMVMMNSS